MNQNIPDATSRMRAVGYRRVSMKDQVDGLRACGYPAAALHSGMSQAEQRSRAPSKTPLK